MSENEDKNKTYERKWYHFYAYCSECFARNDMHDMNCVECCPVKNNEIPEVLYENQEELLEKKRKKLQDLGIYVNLV